MPDNEDILLLVDEDADEETSEVWLVTFADLSMLLLVFFVLLYSMSSLDKERFSQTFTSVTQALGGETVNISAMKITQNEAGVLIDQAMMHRQIVESQRKIYAAVKTLQTTKGVEGVVSANFEDGVITMRIPGDVLFAAGQVDLTPAGGKMISRLRDFFIQHPDQTIKIIGYTDNVPPTGNTRFKDNWEISALRAVNVLRELLAMGIEPNRLAATGFADMNPIYPNSMEEYRAKNRRVEFILQKRITGK